MMQLKWFIYLLFNQLTMYGIFSNLGGHRNIFYTKMPLHQKNCFGGIKNDVTEMIHLLTFQSINNVLYFFKFGGV